MTESRQTGYQTEKIQFTIRDCGGLQPNRPPGFLGAAETISDIEALSSATRGLDILQKTAKAGGPEVERIINGGAKKVVDTVTRAGGLPGGAETVFGAINSINTTSVNNVVGAAEAIRQRIEQDTFEIDDIPVYTRDFANIFKLGGKIFNSGDGSERAARNVCSAPNYAQDLLNIGVKLNHRFFIDFSVNPDYENALGIWDQALMVKQAERPRVEFEYREINSYNYRTKMPVRAEYQPISVTFYDDEDGQVSSFLNQYLKIMSPIANIYPQHPDVFDKKVMNFDNDVVPSFEDIAYSGRQPSSYAQVNANSSSIGYLNSESRQLLHSIRLSHLYKGGGMMDIYTIANPRFTSIEMSDLDMEDGGASTATVTIDYDAVFTETWIVAGDSVIRANQGSLNDISLQMDPTKMILPQGNNGGEGTNELAIEQAINKTVAETNLERSALTTAKNFVFGDAGFL